MAQRSVMRRLHDFGFGLVWAVLLAAVPLVIRAAEPVRTGPELPPGLYAEFVMPSGSFTAELFYTQAPLTVTHFVGLAEGTLTICHGVPFYKGLKWYRVVPNFVIQSGDPTFSPDKKEDDPGQPPAFPDEFVPGLHHDAAGVLSMANGGPDTNGSEFFVTLRDTSRLNYLHSVFGRVVRGIEILPRIAPDEPIVSVRIVRVGTEAKAFVADQTSFDLRRRAAKTYSGKSAPGPWSHFDDPDKLLPLDPPRAKNFNFKLGNFERATGIKLYARVHAKVVPANSAVSEDELASEEAHLLGLDDAGVLAVYFVERNAWGLFVGKELESRIADTSEATTPALRAENVQRAKRALLTAAKARAHAFVADASGPGEKIPVRPALRIKYSVDAVLDALILKLEPRSR
jgi:cyclophilin family peptidyl-prolyl cis-trans isomerase